MSTVALTVARGEAWEEDKKCKLIYGFETKSSHKFDLKHNWYITHLLDWCSQLNIYIRKEVKAIYHRICRLITLIRHCKDQWHKYTL